MLTVEAPTEPRRRGEARTAWAVLTVFGVAFAVAVLWGQSIARHARSTIALGAVPFFGVWGLAISLRLVLAMIVAAGIVVVLPRLAANAPWHRVLTATALCSMAFGAALAFSDRPSDRWQAIHMDYGQHISLVDAFGGPTGFLRHYVSSQLSFPTHLSAHPPGMTLLLWAAARVGLHHVWFEAVLALAGAALAGVAALVAARNVAGESFARAAAPFVVIAPAAVWHTNADVVFAGVALTGVALVVVATSATGRRARRLALLGGATFGAALLLTYGAAVLALLMLAVAGWRRRWATLAWAMGAAAATVLVPRLWGFWWYGGLQATRVAYAHDLADVRPYWYFAFANLVVFATALGPAVLVGLARLRDRRAWVLVGGALAAVAVADLSGLSSAETERIWQPFMPLVLLAGAACAGMGVTWGGPRSERRWLAGQAVAVIALQGVLRSRW